MEDVSLDERVKIIEIKKRIKILIWFISINTRDFQNLSSFSYIFESIESLILNATALGFVLELNTMIYDYFMSKEQKKVVEEIAPIFEVTYTAGQSHYHRISG